MKKLILRAWITASLILLVLPTSAAVTKSSDLPDGGQFQVEGGTLRIQFWSDDIVRITYAPGAELPKLTSLSVLGNPAAANISRAEDDQAFGLSTTDIKVKIDKQTGAVNFLNGQDQSLLKEAAQGRSIQPATVHGIKGNSCTLIEAPETGPD